MTELNYAGMQVLLPILSVGSSYLLLDKLNKDRYQAYQLLCESSTD